MSLRSEFIDVTAMDAVKVMTYAAVTYSVGHEIMDFGIGLMNPAPLDAVHIDSWKALFDGIRSAPTLRIGVHLVALAYLGQDVVNSLRPGLLRSEKLEVFGTSAMKKVAIGSVATLVGAPIASAVLTVGPFYAPLVTDGLEAFVSSLPATDEARAALTRDLESPFNLQTLAVFAAYRYMRHELVPETFKGWIIDLRSAIGSVMGDRSSGIRVQLPEDEEPEVSGQYLNKTPDFKRSPGR
nr:hypothetical protein [Neorhizobium tomejilense]